MTPTRPAPLLPLALILTVALTAWWAGLAWRDLGALFLPEPEDMLRLAQIRDWLDGQAFGDLTQQRLGPPGGTDMGGTRLSDFVLAALIRLLSPLIGISRAEIAAVVFWPELLLLMHLLLTGALARKLDPSDTAIAAIAIAALAFPAVALFEPGRIAPHGMLIVSVEAVILAFLSRRLVWALLGAAGVVALIFSGWTSIESGLLQQPIARAVAWAGLPLVATIWGATLAFRRRDLATILFAALLSCALLASFATLDSLTLAAALAAPVLAQMVAAAGRRGIAWQVGAWLASVGLVWRIIGEIALPSPAQAAAHCADRDTLSALGRIDTGAFAAPTGLSAYIVGGTPHRALAGPTPRNVRGNDAVANLLRASPEEAQYQASLWSVDYIALCPVADGGLPSDMRKPGGLADQLLAGTPPIWLDPVSLVGSELLVWRVRPVAAPTIRP